MTRCLAFKNLVSYLDSKGIRYAVLGNTDGFPERIQSDVDIVISRADFRHVDKVVKEFCSESGFHLIQRIKYESSGCYFVLAFFDIEKNTYLFFQIDFCHDYVRSGRKFISSETLLNNSCRAKGQLPFRRLNDAYEFLYYLIKRVHKGVLNEEQFLHLLNCWGNERLKIRALLSDYWSHSSVVIIAAAFDEADISLLQRNVKSLKSNLISNNRVSVKYIVLEAGRIFHRTTSTTGLFVVVLGRDGTGKSTLIGDLSGLFSDVFRKIHSRHFYPGVVLGGNTNPDDVDSSRPHNKIPRNLFKSFLKQIIYLIEFVVGYLVILYPKLITSTFVIFDRYYVDLFVDPLRYRHKGSKGVVWMLHRLLPKPRLWVILDGTTEMIFKRKQELTYEKSESLRGDYLKLARKVKNAHIVDAGRSRQDVLNSAATLIIEHLESRYR